MPVALAEGLAPAAPIHGWLCNATGDPTQTVQVLIHGATYNHQYWDFPYQPERYSWNRVMHAGGYATFAIDRLGIGRSDHPPAPLVDAEAGAFAIHQVIRAIRSGSVGDTRFGRVVLVGHSLGSLESVMVADRWPDDIDALLLTSYLHGVGLNLFVAGFTASWPAQLDPVLGPRGLPPGYTTTRPGARAVFHAPGDSDPAVIEVDEQTKDSITAAEFNSIPLAGFEATGVRVPVGVIEGGEDQVLCGVAPSCRPGTLGPDRTEQSWYPHAPCFDLTVIPAAGHALNLARSAPDAFSAAREWIDGRIGPGGSRPASRPCAPERRG